MRIQKYLFVFILVLSLMLAVPVFVSTAFAQTNYAAGNTLALSKDDVINTDYFAAGGTNILDGTVNGDAYVAGGTVVINGTVNGDVLAAGGNISINGKVTGNVRAAGGQIVISGDVGKNVTLAGGSISIQNPARIAGSVVIAAGNLSLLAPIEKGVTIAGNQVSIDTTIGGNITGAVGQLDILQNAKISGGVNYWSSQKANIAKFTVKDRITYHHTNWNAQKPQLQMRSRIAGVLAGFSILWVLIRFLTAFILGLFLLWCVPVYMQHVATTVATKPWLSLGIGFLIVILAPIAFIVFLITVIGIPLAIILVLSFIVFALLNEIFISYAIGKKILPQKNVMALLAGLFIYSIVSIIPVIGWIWNIAAFFIGLGAIVIVKKQLYTTLRDKKMI